MNIEDCEVGMGAEPKQDIGAIGVSKGEKLIIRKVEKDTNGGCEGYLYFDGKGHVGVSAEHFEPTNKFKVGDEVIWCREKVKIWGMRYDNEVNKFEYAVEGYGKNNGRTIVFENELSPLKKPDELEIGDKFKVKTAEGASKRTNEVLGIFKDDYYNQTKYVAKRMNGTYEGFVDIYNSEMIQEIIYD